MPWQIQWTVFFWKLKIGRLFCANIWLYRESYDLKFSIHWPKNVEWEGDIFSFFKIDMFASHTFSEGWTPFFSSPDPKGHVRYCHHLVSVVRPLTFHILIYSSETTGPNGTKLGRKHLYKVLYKVSSFRPIPPTNMAAKGNSLFWLANVKKIFSSETVWPNGAKLGRRHLCKILYKTSSFSSIRPTNMAAVTKNRTW